MAATGIRPNIDLAREAGIPVGKGVLVDDYMRTRVRGVFAAGDVAEHGNQVFGLWPVAVEQAEAAAVNALGGDMIVTAETPATILKGVGLELSRSGRPMRHRPTKSSSSIVRPCRRTDDWCCPKAVSSAQLFLVTIRPTSPRPRVPCPRSYG